MIKSMYDLGIPLETIAKASKLSVHDVERILENKYDKSEREHNFHYALSLFYLLTIPK